MTARHDRVGEVGRREFVHAALAGGAVGVLAVTDRLAAQAPPEPDGTWPTYRRDPALAAESPLVGGFSQAPVRAWSADLGGPPVLAESIVVGDVWGDGREAFLTLGPDSVTCRTAQGEVLWRLDDLVGPVVHRILDFAGDGSRGILLTSTRAGLVNTYLVNGRSGKATHLWLDQNNFGGHTRVGKLLPDVRGLQIAATASGQTPPAPQGGDVRLVSFEDGLDQPRFRIRQHVTGVFYSPLFVFADLDGDGQDELVVVSHEQIWAFDAVSGRQKLYSAYGPSIRTYMATIAAVKLQPTDAFPAVVMINHSLPGLKAVGIDSEGTARERWKVVVGGVADQYQKRITLGPAGTSLVYDPAGNGRHLILAAIRNEHDDGATRLVVFEARTGRRLAEFPESEVLAADDLDGDGHQELLVRRGGELHICRWQDDDLRSVWQQADVVPLVRPLPLEGDRQLFSSTSVSTKGNAGLWRHEPGSDRFLLRFTDGVRACRFAQGQLESGPLVTQHEALGNPPGQMPPSQRVVWDGAKVVTLVDGRETYRYVPPAPPTYLAPPPLVADLAGQRRILIRDSQGRFRWCDAAGRLGEPVLERPYEIPELVCDSTGAGIGPRIVDIDGDGRPEILATVKNAQGRPACVILDESGHERRRIDLPPGMTAMNLGPTGRLGPGRGRWFLLRMSGENAQHERQFLVAAYDGKSGQQLWVRSHYGFYGQNPVVFVAHFPSAVLDYDGDGADDWLVCSENFYGILNVARNVDLVGPTTLSDALAGHWTAYTFPSLAPLERGGPPVVVHHSAYSLALITDLAGQPLWHYGMTRDTASRWGQFADLDGDGRRELIHVQPDGRLRCFSVGPPTRCPTCPPETAVPDAGAPLQRWELDLGRPINRLIAADLDADGRQELLFGCDDGKLYALGERDGQPRVLWTVGFGRRVGEPILVDLGERRGPAILVTSEDGQLHCLRPR